MENIEKYCLKVDTEFEIREEMYGTYDTNNGKVAFITDKGEYFVSPFFFEMIESLEELGYKKGSFPVYYSNWDTPKDPEEAKRWEIMREQAKDLFEKRQEREYTEKCAELAKKARIRELPQEAYDKSFAIPKEGLDTLYYGHPDRINPEFLYNMEQDLGTYWQNNGKVAFIDETGTVYVSPYSHEITDLLEDAGYKEHAIAVPLSNQEDIKDPELNEKWQKMREEARKSFDNYLDNKYTEKCAELAKKARIRELPQEAYDKSFAIPKEGLDTLYYGHPDRINPEFLYNMEQDLGTYWQNNGKVAFIDETGTVYVSPYSHEITDLLEDAGYKEHAIAVPLSNQEDIKDPELNEKWQKMREEARKSFDNYLDNKYTEKCAELAEKAGISELPQEVYDKSFAIPKEGLDTIFLGEADRINPEYQYKMEEDLGCYYQNNGKVAFIDETGTVYVTPFSFDVTDLLEEAGYKEQAIHVPLSNQEDIKDPELDAKWKNMCQQASEEFEKRQSGGNTL